MRVLAIDTSTPAITAGLVELTEQGQRALAVSAAGRQRAHAELLAPELAELTERAGLPEAVVCGIGPGAFTGLRVGMVTAASFGHALGIPVYPVCSLDAIAALAGDGPMFVVTDARRKELFWAEYDERGIRADGPGVEAPEAVRERVAGRRVLGDGSLDGELASVRPDGLVAVAAPSLRAGTEPEPLTPLYLRRPDAKEPLGRKRVSR